MGGRVESKNRSECSCDPTSGCNAAWSRYAVDRTVVEETRASSTSAARASEHGASCAVGKASGAGIEPDTRSQFCSGAPFGKGSVAFFASRSTGKFVERRPVEHHAFL